MMGRSAQSLLYMFEGMGEVMAQVDHCPPRHGHRWCKHNEVVDEWNSVFGGDG